MHHTVFIRLPSPLSTLQLHLPATTSLSALPLSISADHGFLRRTSSGPLSPALTLADLANEDGHPIHLEYAVRFLGGKGGFGSQLRAAGGRMSSGKATNNDSCRDLSGRRLATVKEAQKWVLARCLVSGQLHADHHHLADWQTLLKRLHNVKRTPRKRTRRNSKRSNDHSVLDLPIAHPPRQQQQQKESHLHLG